MSSLKNVREDSREICWNEEKLFEATEYVRADREMLNIYLTYSREGII
jgi:hypothetical protein